MHHAYFPDKFTSWHHLCCYIYMYVLETDTVYRLLSYR
jgi:hypothetical protein